MAADRIVLLDENTANRIAAGEVVERPASAVKELVENAIDAGATQIVVGLEEGGKQRILVSDNGCGMTRSDAILALQRHATSKIRSADDLFAIHTLGFRGEALPSIASISRFILTTKPVDEESGTRLVVEGGDIVAAEEVAARDGTTMEVGELFYNTPARLKFLKSTPTEVARAVEVVGHLAVAYPSVAFRLKNGTAEVFSTPGTGEPLSALAAVWGRDIARKLIPIRNESPGLVVSGYIATPDITRPGRSHELFYVNRRPIKSRLLGHALEEAYRALTPESRYPIAAVFVEINPELVDVNVHPTKTEVKFTRDGEVHHAVSQAIKSALLAYGIVPTARIQQTGNDAQGMPSGTPGFQGSLDMGRADYREHGQDHRTGTPHEHAAVIRGFAPFEPLIEATERAFAGSPDGNPFPPSDTVPNDPFAEAPTVASLPQDEAIVERPRPRPFAEQLRAFRVLGQARNTYIIALTPDGIAVIDQHVAHERVLYERLTVKRFSAGIPVQHLAVPLTLTLSRREALLLAEHCASFATSGWDIAPFGGESFVVRAIPAMLVNKSYEQILRDMIDELVNQSVSRRLLVQQEHVTITNACKLAVKAGDPLTIEEMSGLLEQLAETENPYLCPHGRPIVVTVSFHELDKQFKRA
ncbi:MAG TPA: DNA mismatch repair endonuclease MutL [Chthonomonadaceae bacterium]|nr:DNA mismatch repair endonuclease MutL [Chthonomonadaceae bacterium]